YFVKFIQAYQSMGIPIWAVTAQNEAVRGWFLSLSQSKETNFIGAHLGPALASAGLGNVKIFAMDDQWSNASYGQAVYTANPHDVPVGHHHDGPGQPGRVSGPLRLQRGGKQQDVPDHRRKEQHRAHRQH